MRRRFYLIAAGRHAQQKPFGGAELKQTERERRRNIKRPKVLGADARCEQHVSRSVLWWQRKRQHA